MNYTKEMEMIFKLHKSLKITVGYHDSLLNDTNIEKYYQDLNVEPNHNYFSSYLNVSKFKYNKQVAHFYENDDLSYHSLLLKPNSQYDDLQNSLGNIF